MPLGLAGAMTFAALLFSGCEKDPATPTPNESAIAPARDANELILNLEETYRRRDFDEFVKLFPSVDDQLDFVFRFVDQSGTREMNLTDFLRIHRRLFAPQEVPPGDSPVPAELWLETITVDIQPLAEPAERDDWYAPLGPLDGSHWRALELSTRTSMFLGTQGDTDFSVDSRVNFLVVENRNKLIGQAGKFLFYRIEDLGAFRASLKTAVNQKTWSAVLKLYG